MNPIDHFFRRTNSDYWPTLKEAVAFVASNQINYPCSTSQREHRWLPQRSDVCREFDEYPIRLRDPLPIIGIPLADDDPDVPLELQAVVERAYESGAFEEKLRYDRPCKPPLDADDQAWAEELIRASGWTPPVEPAAS